jgi:hypothetical protein
MDEFSPSRLVTHDDYYSLCFDEFNSTYDLLEARELQGGGYTWHAIVDALVRTRAPQIAHVVKYDPEGSMFVAYGSDLEALKTVAGLIRSALENEAVLLEALEAADPDLLE